jgi:hypothetical protein
MDNVDVAVRIEGLGPLGKGLALLQLALLEAGRFDLAADMQRMADPDGQGAAVPLDLVDALIARVQGEELRAWMIAFGRVADMGGEALMAELSTLARKRLAH